MDIIPYHELTEQLGSSGVKNQASCHKLASILESRILPPDANPDTPALIFPFNPVTTSELAARYSSKANLHVYGAIVPHKNMADKAMLHELVPDAVYSPTWYKPSFSRGCIPAVLPGYTVFTQQDIHKAIALLKQDGFDKQIMKDPSADRGQGQVYIDARHPYHFRQPIDNLRMNGRVIEPFLSPGNLRTYSVGTMLIGRHAVSWIGEIWTQWHEASRESLFESNKMIAIKGDLYDLQKHVQDPTLQRAVAKSRLVHSQYPRIDVLVQRATYDILHDSNSDVLFGVVDPSLRPSASTPGEIVALEYMAQQQKDYVTLEVRYRRPASGSITIDPDEVVFAASHRVTITTRIMS